MAGAAFGTGDHKPRLVPGQAQPPPGWARGGYFYENMYIQGEFITSPTKLELVTASLNCFQAGPAKAKIRMNFIEVPKHQY